MSAIITSAPPAVNDSARWVPTNPAPPKMSALTRVPSVDSAVPEPPFCVRLRPTSPAPALTQVRAEQPLELAHVVAEQVSRTCDLGVAEPRGGRVDRPIEPLLHRVARLGPADEPGQAELPGKQTSHGKFRQAAS